ncbi:MAG: metallophosphoesterase family protein, partial [Firmicutes bacterium]|nr:metallophosphoesterase family protein [Bacillota bacterium]
YTLIGTVHQQIVPKFALEPTLTKDFMVYNWRRWADYFADKGMRYVFTGHMHANQISHHISWNGNQITDIETSSVNGYMSSARYVTIERGNINVGNGAVYAENLITELRFIGETDFTDIFKQDAIGKAYVDTFGLDKHLKFELPNGTRKDFNSSTYKEEIASGAKIICVNPGEYAADRIFYGILESIKVGYIDADFIDDMLQSVPDMLTSALDGILNDDIVQGFADIAVKLIDNIIYHVENVVLDGYEYSGTVDRFKPDPVTGKYEKYARLFGFVEEIANRAVAIQVTDTDTLLSFAIGAYLRHCGGLGVPESELSDNDRQGLNSFKNGTTVKALFDVLLDEEVGLLRVVKGLSEPINIGRNMSASELSKLESLLNGVALFSGKLTSLPKFDGEKFLLDGYIPIVLGFLDNFMGLSLPVEGAGLWEMANNLMESYLTDSIYTGLGSIAHDILFQFMSTDNPSGYKKVGDVVGGTVQILFPTAGNVIYIKGRDMQESPSVENGKLPSMLAVTFGADASTDKNFVWFTDHRATITAIEYWTTDENDKTLITNIVNPAIASYKNVITTTAGLDVGLFSSLIPVQLRRNLVQLKDLTPNTEYSYRVGSYVQKDGKIAFGETMKFKTAPNDNQPFEALILADLQAFAKYAYEESYRAIVGANEVFGSQGYDFVITAGDMVDNGRNLAHWQHYLNVMPDVWGNTSKASAPGNHEGYRFCLVERMESDKFLKYMVDIDNWTNAQIVANRYNYFDLFFEYPTPTGTSGAYLKNPNQLNPDRRDQSFGGWYSFDYSNVTFIVLSTNDSLDGTSNGVNANKNPDYQFNSPNARQMNWLNSELKRANDNNNLIAVVMHKGLYTAGSHSYDSDIIEMRTWMPQMFFDYGVNLVISGHDHTYTETYFLDGNGKKVGSNGKGEHKLGANQSGVLYVTVGTIGNKLYNYVENPDVLVEFGSAIHDPILANPTFGRLRYDGTYLYYMGFEYDLTTGKITPVHDLPKSDPPSTGLPAWAIALIVVGIVIVLALDTLLILYIVQKKKKEKALCASEGGNTETSRDPDEDGFSSSIAPADFSKRQADERTASEVTTAVDEENE